MAKVKLNKNIKAIWGRIGNLVFRRSHTGEVQLSTLPDMSHVQWSPAQQAHRQRMKAAVADAHAAMANEQVRAWYQKEAANNGNRPFNLAISDYFKGRDLLKGV